jgi:hypothetical protein
MDDSCFSSAATAAMILPTSRSSWSLSGDIGLSMNEKGEETRPSFQDESGVPYYS